MRSLINLVKGVLLLPVRLIQAIIPGRSRHRHRHTY